MLRAADKSVRRSLAASFVPELVEILKNLSLQLFRAVMCMLVKKCDKIVPDTQVQLSFMKSRHSMAGIPWR